MLAVPLAAASVTLAACQSTQATSEQRAVEGAELIQDKSIKLEAENREIEIVDTTVLSDVNGSAVVVTLRNTAKEAFVNVPIQIDVKDAKGKSIFKNDQVGLEPSLISLPVIEAGQTVDWIHDQVLAAGTPKSVDVTVGRSSDQPPPELPKIELGRARLTTDPTSGIEASGSIENRSEIQQLDIVINGVARKGGRIVAAGRGQLRKLDPGKRKKPAEYHIFFIGNPTGAEIEVTAPPTVLE